MGCLGESLTKLPHDLTESGAFSCAVAVMRDSEVWERTNQLKDELVWLYNQQTEFYRKGSRLTHTPTEITEFDSRRERIREVFAEIGQLSESSKGTVSRRS